MGGRVDDGWVGGWVDGWVDMWVGGWMGGWVGGWKNGWVGGQEGGWVGGLDGWMDGWVDGWVCGAWWVGARGRARGNAALHPETGAGSKLRGPGHMPCCWLPNPLVTTVGGRDKPRWPCVQAAPTDLSQATTQWTSEKKALKW